MHFKLTVSKIMHFKHTLFNTSLPSPRSSDLDLTPSPTPHSGSNFTWQPHNLTLTLPPPPLLTVATTSLDNHTTWSWYLVNYIKHDKQYTHKTDKTPNYHISSLVMFDSYHAIKFNDSLHMCVYCWLSHENPNLHGNTFKILHR